MEAFTKGIPFFCELNTLQISFRHGKMTIYGVLIVIVMLCYTDCNPASTCDKTTSTSGLNSAVDMIAKVKSTLPAGSTATSTCEEKMAECYLETAVGMITDVKSAIPASSTATYTCEEKMAVHYLDTAVGMIREAKSTLMASISCEKNIHREKNITRRALDCSELLEMGYNTSGVYTIWPKDKSLKVYCDMQTNGGGWTLIQRRGNFGRPVDYFFKDWKSYKDGFGDIEEDFWLGNDNIYVLTNQKNYSARFDLKAVEISVLETWRRGYTRYAEYSTFRIDDENHKYTLHVDNYTGDAGDSLSYHHNMKFSTKDQDNDKRIGNSCAQRYKGAWWYNDCLNSNLNGLYLRGKHEEGYEGVNWYHWKGPYESLESTEIKIRPKNIKLQNTSMITPM